MNSVLGGVGMVLLSLLLLSPQDSRAQQWFQTTSIVVPIQEEGPIRTFLDSLTRTIEEGDLQVRRAPDRENRPLAALQDSLIAEHGVDIDSANVVFIDYRLEYSSRSQYQETIKSFHFYFRSGLVREDLPLLYIDAQQKWVQDLLTESGTSLPTREESFVSFHEQFEFVRLAWLDETEIVEIGGKSLREGFAVEKRALLLRVQHLMYKGLGS